MSGRIVVIGMFVLAVLGSAIANVYVTHLRRELFIALQVLGRSRDAMQIEWGQLQLEQSTWATNDRIESLAREKLGMRTPELGAIVLVELGAHDGR